MTFDTARSTDIIIVTHSDDIISFQRNGGASDRHTRNAMQRTARAVQSVSDVAADDSLHSGDICIVDSSNLVLPSAAPHDDGVRTAISEDGAVRPISTIWLDHRLLFLVVPSVSFFPDKILPKTSIVLYNHRLIVVIDASVIPSFLHSLFLHSATAPAQSSHHRHCSPPQVITLCAYREIASSLNIVLK